ncbi:Guanylate cyclase soluble subunit alpha-1 [Bulinus truncatus]|nr:Guanylate cyclase soluble subunit alpha-1 [Bulinus truncatus]
MASKNRLAQIGTCAGQLGTCAGQLGTCAGQLGTCAGQLDQIAEGYWFQLIVLLFNVETTIVARDSDNPPPTIIVYVLYDTRNGIETFQPANPKWDTITSYEMWVGLDGLKKRMEQLKKSIETASRAVDVEKQKNVDLLLEIFPPTVAQRLWRGELVEPATVDDVTMLFSDIVGFTAICSTATPMQVVDMLNSLYTHFDQFCVDIDVYKIETIGDAYCVAGGLHRVSKYHAQQIAWMALKMMSAAKNEKSHDGAMIKVG